MPFIGFRMAGTQLIVEDFDEPSGASPPARDFRRCPLFGATSAGHDCAYLPTSPDEGYSDSRLYAESDFFNCDHQAEFPRDDKRLVEWPMLYHGNVDARLSTLSHALLRLFFTPYLHLLSMPAQMQHLYAINTQ